MYIDAVAFHRAGTAGCGFLQVTFGFGYPTHYGPYYGYYPCCRYYAHYSGYTYYYRQYWSPGITTTITTVISIVGSTVELTRTHRPSGARN